MAEGNAADRVSELRIDRDQGGGGGRRRRRKLLVALAAVALLVVLAVAWSASRPPALALAQVREARPGEAATVLTSAGYVVASRRTIVAPQISGKLERVLVEEGQKLDDAQVIARLADADQRVALERAKAAADTSAAQLRVAQVQAADAARTYERTRKLTRSGAATQEAFDQASASLRSARAQRSAAAATLAEARRAIEAAELQLGYTVVRAPFAATVVRKIADEGSVLAPAAIEQTDLGGIVELVDLGSLAVDADVSEEQLRSVRTGQPALVFLEAFPGRTLLATVGTVRPEIDKATATAKVRVEFPQPPDQVLPDMAATIAFLKHPLTEKALAEEARLRVPASAVVERDGRTVVFVVEEGRAYLEPVRVERRLDSELSLAQGPKPGASVVAEPPEELQDGEVVRVAEEGK